MKTRRQKGGKWSWPSFGTKKQNYAVTSRFHTVAPADDLTQGGEQLIYVTRHANSCNNIVKNYEFLNKKKDPSLTVFGVVSTLKHNPAHILDVREPVSAYQVYVSCCIRTWMTAILLYGRKCKFLTLVIAPYLKEFGEDPGNMPESIDIQVKKMQRFFKFLKLLNELGEINGLLNPVINCHIVIKLGNNNVYEYPNTTPVISTLESREPFQTYARNKLNAIMHVDPSLKKSPLSAFVNCEYGHEQNDSLDYGGQYSPEMTTFYADGIARFSSWARPPSYPIYVVAHSKLMTAALKQFKVDLGEVTETNEWTMEIIKRGNSIQLKRYIDGIKKSQGYDSKLEYLCISDESAYQEIGRSWTGKRAPESNMHRQYARKLASDYSGMTRVSNALAPVRNWTARNWTAARNRVFPVAAPQPAAEKSEPGAPTYPKNDQFSFGGRRRKTRRRRRR
jgi:hypothetical protein